MSGDQKVAHEVREALTASKANAEYPSSTPKAKGRKRGSKEAASRMTSLSRQPAMTVANYTEQEGLQAGVTKLCSSKPQP